MPTFDPKQFREIYEAHLPFVWNLLRRLGVAERDLEDKAHDVFMVLFRRSDELDVQRPLRPWIGGVVVRVAADHRRLAGVSRVELEAAPELPDCVARGERLQRDIESRQLVEAALCCLDDKKREVFVLSQLEGYSMPQLEAMLDEPLNTLYSRLRLARGEFVSAVERLSGKRGAK